MVAAARARLGSRAEFVHADLNEYRPSEPSRRRRSSEPSTTRAIAPRSSPRGRFHREEARLRPRPAALRARRRPLRARARRVRAPDLHPFFVPQSVALPRPVQELLLVAERLGPLASALLRLRFTYICAAREGPVEALDPLDRARFGELRQRAASPGFAEPRGLRRIGRELDDRARAARPPRAAPAGRSRRPGRGRGGRRPPPRSPAALVPSPRARSCRSPRRATARRRSTRPRARAESGRPARGTGSDRGAEARSRCPERGFQRAAARDVQLQLGHLLEGRGEGPQEQDVPLDRDQPPRGEQARRPVVGRDGVAGGDAVVDDLEASPPRTLRLGQVAGQPARDGDPSMRQSGEAAVGERERADLRNSLKPCFVLTRTGTRASVPAGWP